MKRTAEDDPGERPVRKKAAVKANGSPQFRQGLLQEADKYHKQYIDSQPYKHGLIQNLLDPQLLRNVRAEIQANLSFTPKETDIYRIHQSGDLANLDGLDDSSLKLLPSLLALRDALYSPSFRHFLSTVTGAGLLSGTKTDMAINVYTPGCHLLCHDDVIGSRRVSYILYLTDPDRPWKPEWGGALRLYPTVTHKAEDKSEVKVPSPDCTVSIPPAFNQLSFFAVQPGESFHDVEEVYSHHLESGKDGVESRVRMAISGWYHIPQKGEDGYVEGLEESLAERSSLQQLQGSGDQYDKPRSGMKPYRNNDREELESTAVQASQLKSSQDEAPLTEDDLEFLLKYIAPTYLTPDTLESVSDTFVDDCSICLGKFLNKKFSSALRDYIKRQETQALPSASQDIEKTTAWQVARPPHKHRFLYQQASNTDASNNEDNHDESPIQDLLRTLLPSEAFRKWLQLATGLTLSSHDLCARRFRRGQDYTLATGYSGDESQLEITLALTPTRGWGGDDNLADDDDDDEAADEQPKDAKDSNVKNTSTTKDTEAEDGKVKNASTIKDTEAEDSNIKNAATTKNTNSKDSNVENVSTTKDTEAEDSKIKNALTTKDTKAEDSNVEKASTTKDTEAEDSSVKKASTAKDTEAEDSNVKGASTAKDTSTTKHTEAEDSNVKDASTAKHTSTVKGTSTAKDTEAEDSNVKDASTTKDTQAEDSNVKDASTTKDTEAEEPAIGGYLAYMAGDDVDDNSSDDSDGVEVPPDLSTGAHASKPTTQKNKKNKKASKADPAVYYEAATEDDDDGILLSMPPGWNTLGVVLRDKGVMRFVKYVSRQAPGDRWDVVGEFGVVPAGEDEEGGVGVSDGELASQPVPGLVGVVGEESETEIASLDDDDSSSDD
ncbi:MAG: hypothetical protein LQ345_004288 [Seirophora villosa]|nr:MAG: hypothetical protein LQ345_004288 [Seirophora villosa]